MFKDFELNELATFVSGGTPSKSNPNYWNGDIPWVSAKDMKQNFISDSEDHISSLGAANGTRILPKGSTIMLVRGMTLHNYIPICFSNRELAINQDVKGLLPKENIRPLYLYYLLQGHHDQLHQLVDSAGHGTGRLNSDQLLKFKVKVPPLEIQDKLLSIISPFDDRINLNKEIIDSLESMAKAVFKEWFIDFGPVKSKAEGKKPFGIDDETAAILPDIFEESKIGLIPSGWEVKSIDNIANYLNGLALQKFPPTGTNDLPVVKIAQLRANSTKGADLANSHVPPEYLISDGDIVFSWSGTLEVKIWTGGKGALNQHLFKVTSSHYPKWFYWLATLSHLDFFRQVAASKATTMGHIQRSHLNEAKLTCPPANVIEKANDYFLPIFEKLVLLSVESKNLERMRDLLLPKLISGEINLEKF